MKLLRNIGIIVAASGIGKSMFMDAKQLEAYHKRVLEKEEEDKRKLEANKKELERMFRVTATPTFAITRDRNSWKNKNPSGSKYIPNTRKGH